LREYNFALLRNRNVGLLWGATCVSSLGNWVFYTVIAYVVYRASGSVVATSTVFMAQTIPRVAFGSFAGVIADRVNRRVLLVTSDLARAALILLVVWVPLHQVAILDLIIAGEALFTLVFMPARMGLLPTLVDEHLLVSANALLQTSQTLSQLVGPMVGALLLTRVGLPGVVLADTASYGLSAVALGSLVMPAKASGGTSARPPWWTQWREGVQMVMRRPWLRGLALSLVLVSLADGALSPGIVAYVRTVLHQTVLAYGAFQSAAAIGSLMGGFLLTAVGRWIPADKTIALGLGAAGLMLTTLFVTPFVPLAILLYGAFSLANVLWLVSYGTVLQSRVEPSAVGRTSAFIGSLSGFAMLGGLGLLDLLDTTVPLGVLLIGTGIVVVVAGGLAYITGRRRPSAVEERAG
jgi:MFS family permease